jgi:hypothetical protein
LGLIAYFITFNILNNLWEKLNYIHPIYIQRFVSDLCKDIYIYKAGLNFKLKKYFRFSPILYSISNQLGKNVQIIIIII